MQHALEELLPVKLKYSLPVEMETVYMYIARPAFMEQWLADSVDVEEEDIFVFRQGDKKLRARLVQKVPGRMIKFEWIEHPEKQGKSLIFQVAPCKEEEEGLTTLYVFDCCYQLEQEILAEDWNKLVEKLLRAIQSDS